MKNRVFYKIILSIIVLHSNTYLINAYEFNNDVDMESNDVDMEDLNHDDYRNLQNMMIIDRIDVELEHVEDYYDDLIEQRNDYYNHLNNDINDEFRNRLMDNIQHIELEINRVKIIINELLEEKNEINNY